MKRPTKATKRKASALRGRKTMRDSIYPFATLTRPGKTITMPVGKRGQPTEHQLRSAAWAYGSRNGFRVRTQWYDSRKTAIVITRIRGRK